MINVNEALQMVLAETPPATPTTVELKDAIGRILAEPVCSDIDSPPHTKSLVDGYAIRADELVDGAEFNVLEEVTAGAVPTQPLIANSAIRIMTGAPVPEGADAVVMIERATEKEGRVSFDDKLRPGDNILPQATVMKCGEAILNVGHEVRAIEIGLMAEVGKSEVAVFRPPRVAVLSTGNELVEPAQTPGPGQIRNSNGSLLAAQVSQTGATCNPLGIGPDDMEQLTELVRKGLDSEVLVLSGGVSAGVLDLVPQVLANCGVRQVFHKVNLKPGKPIWFGVTEKGTLVFGLPGNPVSTLVCFELFVRPAIDRLSGRISKRDCHRGRMTQSHRQKGDRATYFPAKCEWTSDSQWAVTPVFWKGSADQRSLVEANGLIHLPPGAHDYASGDEVTFSFF